jgi:dethiobiotin synthase
VARGFFVTGTDTGVGKTVVSAALLCRLRKRGPVRYWKPIQTGIEQDDDTEDVRRLARAAAREIRDDGIRLERPVSPHLAARLAGERIDLAALTLPAQPDESVAWIVEGAGGVLVPINERDLMIHLMGRLALPVVVAARSTLGTINHTLLTIGAVRNAGLHLAGVVMVGDPDAANREAIEHYGRTTVLGELPRMNPLTPDSLSAWATGSLDPAGRMMESWA